jgi:DNA-directed RNA polymerase subunit RPC12/RpoP
MNKVPVVAVLHRGNHLGAPVWDVPNKRRVPHHTTLTQILTAEQVKTMSVDEINEAIRSALQYDDYQYQKDNGILITEPNRAQNLHKVLYKCPHCGAEAMDSAGAEIFCTECGKRWVWQEDGYLKATEGETEFDHIPDWFKWERQEVKKEIENGTYHWEDEVEVYSLPRCWRYIPLGKAKLTHDIEKGFILEGHYRDADYFIQRTPDQSNSLHVEYGFPALDKTDYVDISTENDSFYCRPTKRNCITKLALATEELHLHNRAKALISV